MKKNVLILIAVVAAFCVGILFWQEAGAPTTDDTATSTPVGGINSFDDCVAAGNPVLESYPEQCNTKDGKHFVRDIGNEIEKQDLITADTPRPNTKITSPLKITGKARGNWFFEASFPIRLLDANGTVIAENHAQATGDWMTEAFVPFTSTITFNNPSTATGTLVLMKDNPSGLPEMDDALLIPVKFK